MDVTGKTKKLIGNILMWEKIKEILTEGHKINSVGYQKQLILASKILFVLNTYKKLDSCELRSFNEDKEVTEALINKQFLDAI